MFDYKFFTSWTHFTSCTHLSRRLFVTSLGSPNCFFFFISLLCVTHLFVFSESVPVNAFNPLSFDQLNTLQPFYSFISFYPFYPQQIHTLYSLHQCHVTLFFARSLWYFPILDFSYLDRPYLFVIVCHFTEQ